MQECGPRTFEEAHEQTNGNAYTPVFEVMKLAGTKALFTGGADELLNDMIYKFFDSKHFPQRLVHHLIKSSSFTVPVVCFIKKQSEKGASGAKFTHDLSRKIAAKKEVTPSWPLTGRSPKSPKRSKNEKKEKKVKPSSDHHFKSSSGSKCVSSRHSDDYKADNGDEVPKKAKALKLVNTLFTTASNFNIYRLQKRSED